MTFNEDAEGEEGYARWTNDVSQRLISSCSLFIGGLCFGHKYVCKGCGKTVELLDAPLLRNEVESNCLGCQLAEAEGQRASRVG